jgi:hypothetical protein
MSERRYVAFHWALILATPFLILAVDSNLFINPNTNFLIDSWVYSGFFLSLPDHLARWGDTYYATRLSWLLPGYAAHQVLPPLVANYVLHFGFFYVLLFSIYALVTSAVHRTAACIATLLVAWSPEVIAAMSWDYVDGAVITYLAVTLLCLEKASSSPNRWQWAAASGAALTCLGSANLVATTLWPICVLFLVLRVGFVRWRSVLAILAVAAVGAVATLAVFGFANQMLGGQFLFFKPSVSYASTRMWVPSPWDVEGLGWLPDAPFLILPAVAAFGAIVALVGRFRTLRTFSGSLQAIVLTAVVWWVVHSVLWSHSMHLSFYISYLLPLGLLALALHPDSPIHLTPSRLQRAAAMQLAILGLLIVHLLVFRGGDIAWATAASAVGVALATPFGINAYVAFAIASIALVALRFVRTPWFRWPAFLVMLVMPYSSVPSNWASPDTAHLQDDFAVSVSAHRFIGQHLDQNRGLRMWYALAPNEPRPFKNISSTYLWGWTLVNEAMPTLAPAQAALLAPDTQLVMMAARRGEVDAAQQALQAFGLEYVPRVQHEFTGRGSNFWVIIGEMSRIRR